MSRAFVLGNGISRAGLDLPALQAWGCIYGCNALYRTFAPDVLVATDGPISACIMESGYARNNKFYTRRPTADSGAHALPSQYRGYSSGPNAVGLACTDGNLSVYLLGFDMGPDSNQRFNNIYANTEFYKTSAHPPTFTGNWATQMSKIMSEHKLVRFFRVQGPTTAPISKFDNISNLTHLDIDTFTNRINNKKDL